MATTTKRRAAPDTFPSGAELLLWAHELRMKPALAVGPDDDVIEEIPLDPAGWREPRERLDIGTNFAFALLEAAGIPLPPVLPADQPWRFSMFFVAIEGKRGRRITPDSFDLVTQIDECKQVNQTSLTKAFVLLSKELGREPRTMSTEYYRLLGLATKHPAYHLEGINQLSLDPRVRRAIQLAKARRRGGH